VIEGLVLSPLLEVEEHHHHRHHLLTEEKEIKKCTVIVKLKEIKK
jgi:hypothetical protein